MIWMSDGRSGGPLVLAVASQGGHWEQMMLLRPMLDTHRVRFVTTERDLLVKAGIADGIVLPDCNRNEPVRSLKCLVRSFATVFRLRPTVIISTGAAPGFFCLLAGRMIGARTVWIDSVANVEKLSKSGQIARFVATDWLTQWEHVARPNGPHYIGGVL
jgi:UDP-N-acetylglucosamine:LPS N-acetylglucosamine transferase